MFQDMHDGVLRKQVKINIKCVNKWLRGVVSFAWQPTSQLSAKGVSILRFNMTINSYPYTYKAGNSCLKKVLCKVWGKKTGHFLRSVAHQISILALKFIKRGPNKMS